MKIETISFTSSNKLVKEEVLSASITCSSCGGNCGACVKLNSLK